MDNKRETMKREADKAECWDRLKLGLEFVRDLLGNDSIDIADLLEKMNGMEEKCEALGFNVMHVELPSIEKIGEAAKNKNNEVGTHLYLDDNNLAKSPKLSDRIVKIVRARGGVPISVEELSDRLSQEGKSVTVGVLSSTLHRSLMFELIPGGLWRLTSLGRKNGKVGKGLGGAKESCITRVVAGMLEKNGYPDNSSLGGALKVGKRKSLSDLIVEVLKENRGPMSRDQIKEYLLIKKMKAATNSALGSALNNCPKFYQNLSGEWVLDNEV